MATPEAALAASRIGRLRTIFIGPGEFSAHLSVHHDPGDGVSDDGLRILGCGSDETTLAAVTAADPIVVAAELTDFQLEGLQLAGGTRPLWIWQGANVTLTDLVIHDGATTGLLVDGADTVVTAVSIAIENTTAGEGKDDGYGLVVSRATMTLDNAAVARNRRVGIFVTGGSLTTSNLSVIDTAPGDTDLDGYGIYADVSTLIVDGAVLQRNRVASVRVHMSVDTQLARVTISETAANDAGLYGDGILLSQTGDMDPKYFLHSLVDCVVIESTRTGILADAVTVSALDGNSVRDNGYTIDGVSIIAQEGAAMPAVGDAWAAATTTLDYP